MKHVRVAGASLPPNLLPVSDFRMDGNVLGFALVLSLATGLLLFLVTLTLNVIALQVVRRYREQYD
jgi:ABC-type phosphate transport system permease subunit